MRDFWYIFCLLKLKLTYYHMLKNLKKLFKMHAFLFSVECVIVNNSCNEVFAQIIAVNIVSIGRVWYSRV